MSKPLPPLDHLHAFEVAARHLSFKKSAHEMNVTPAAIGQRGRSLESILKCALFVRHTRQVDLTPEGRLLFEDISQPLTGLKNSISRHWGRQNSPVLHISTTNNFTELNLLPVLPGFTDQFPDADVRIVSTNKKLDLDKYEADVCIRLGPGPVRGNETYSFGDQTYIPVCSPDLFRKFSEPESMARILDLPLIEEEWAVEIASAPSWKK